MTSRARQVGTTTFVAVALEAEPAEQRVLPLGRRLDADQRVGALGPEARPPAARAARRARPRRAVQRAARELEHEPRREVGRRPGEVRVDALLPAVRALGAQAVALGGAVDPVRLEVRRLEQDGRRLVADLGLLAAHDPGERDAALGVGDQQVVGHELAVDAVERAQLLARRRAADDDLPAGELR